MLEEENFSSLKPLLTYSGFVENWHPFLKIVWRVSFCWKQKLQVQHEDKDHDWCEQDIKWNQKYAFLSDPSGTDLSLVFSSPPSSSSSSPVSDYYFKCLIYRIQALGSPQPIHFLKAHDVSSTNTDENTNTKTKTVTKTMTKTKTPREWLKQ